MTKHSKIKQLVLLLFFLIPTAWSGAVTVISNDGSSPILIKAVTVQGTPKDSSILASVDGHYLTVVFTENLGEVRIVVTEADGGTFDMIEMYTPNGYSANILDTGSYVVTFYLTNGDEYYGEFEVTE